MGNIILEIDTEHAPVTAKNFLAHIENGTFKNAVFYRTVRPDNQPNNFTIHQLIRRLADSR